MHSTLRRHDLDNLPLEVLALTLTPQTLPAGILRFLTDCAMAVGSTESSVVELGSLLY